VVGVYFSEILFFCFLWVYRMKIRISLVHYLNSAPLGWAFLHGPLRRQFEVIPSSPAYCADQLSRGEVDIGLIPSIEYERIPDLRIIPNISISSLAAVRSILLIRPRGISTIRSVALDTSSRTSVALTKIVLHANMGLAPEYSPFEPNISAMLRKCDAALLIGDPALKIQPEDYETIDLAEKWVEWQQKPFVCAFWASRNDGRLPADLVSIFEEAKEWGLQRRGEIASFFSKSLDLPVQFLEDYLMHNIDYDLGKRHLEGLQRFYQLAEQERLIPKYCPLSFCGEE
jgi:chorismate dehydratase